jgi:hypothetical protein
MGETARGAAAENEPNRGPATFDGEVAGVDSFVPNVDNTHKILSPGPHGADAPALIGQNA